MNVEEHDIRDLQNLALKRTGEEALQGLGRHANGDRQEDANTDVHGDIVPLELDLHVNEVCLLDQVNVASVLLVEQNS